MAQHYLCVKSDEISDGCRRTLIASSASRLVALVCRNEALSMAPVSLTHEPSAVNQMPLGSDDSAAEPAVDERSSVPSPIASTSTCRAYSSGPSVTAGASSNCCCCCYVTTIQDAVDK